MHLSLKDWAKLVFIPFVVAFSLDQLTKQLALRDLLKLEFGPLHHLLLKNQGLMLGSMDNFSKVYTTVVPATLAGFILFIFFSLQYFLPIRSAWLRIGASIFCGSVASNILDRIRFGYVVDFLVLQFGRIETGVFNVADVLQWVGVALLTAGFLASEKNLYPDNQKRGKLWIKPKFQLRYCMTLLSVGAAFSIISGLMSYSFLSVTVSRITGSSPDAISHFIAGFIQIYSATSITFFMIIFYLGVRISHRIVGPVAGFEAYINDLMQGKMRSFKVRETDEFQELDAIAEKFSEYFHKSGEIEPEQILAGSFAPSFTARSIQNEEFDVNKLADKKIWLLLYRYATCPLCVTHLSGIKDIIEGARQKGVVVLAVYESMPEDFAKTECAKISEFFANANIPLIADPDRKLYLRFKAQRNILALFRPSNIRVLLNAKALGFLEPSTVDGDIAQLPAQFLINRNGSVALAHYGAHFNDFPKNEAILAFINS